MRQKQKTRPSFEERSQARALARNSGQEKLDGPDDASYWVGNPEGLARWNRMSLEDKAIYRRQAMHPAHRN